MKRLQFSVQINAPREVVWEKLWSDAGYRQWTAAFTEGSYAESSWEEGSPIRFLCPSGDGMYGLIKKKTPLEEMTFEHIGEIKNGVEQKQDWAGAIEGYHLQESDGVTDLRVELDTNGEFDSYFNATFPKALARLKEIAEQP